MKRRGLADTRRQSAAAASLADFFTSSSSFRLATTVAAFAEILRDSPYAAGYSLADVACEAEPLTRLYPGDQNVAVVSQLTQTAARLDGARW